MNKKKILSSVVGVALVLAGYHWYQSWNAATVAVEKVIAKKEEAKPEASAAEVQMRPADVLKRKTVPTKAELKAQYLAFMANRPPYLAGTDLPAQYHVDADGNLIVDSAVKDILDYFMLAIGDLPFDKIHDLLAGNMIASLQEPALSQALALLDHYFAYIDSYDTWEKSFDKEGMMASDPASLKNKMADLEALRRQYLGDEAFDAFFGEQTQMNNAYLDAQIALKQPGLTDDERATIVQNLKDSMPADVRQAEAQAMTQVNLAQKTQALRSEGASSEEIYQARVEMVGEAAAKRLEAADEANQEWNQKREQYKEMMSNTPGLDGLSEADKSAYVASLAQKQLGLSANEIKRMQALDRIEATESVQ